MTITNLSYSGISKTYTFKGFGFDVMLKDIEIKSVDGKEYK